MSYIVPDKIPSYCAECDWSICLYPNAYCKRVHKTSELLMAIEKRPDFCPLIEIHTPHGRLIDADVLKQSAHLKGRVKTCIDTWIDSQTTLIEAERSEE